MLADMKEAVIVRIRNEKEKMKKGRQCVDALLERWNDTAALVSVIMLKLTMDFFYVKVVFVIYSHMYGRYSMEPNAGRYIMSWGIFILLWKVMPKEGQGIKTLFLHVQFILIILPMLTIYAIMLEQSTAYMLLVTGAILIECLILMERDKKYRPVKIEGLSGFVSVWFIIFIPLMLALIWTYGGFWGLAAWDWQKLYKIRAAAEYPVILSYIIPWLTLTIVPFYIAYSLEKQKYILTGILIVIDIFLYMIVPNKIIYLSLAVVIGVYILAKSKHLLKLLYMGLTGLMLLLSAIFFFERKSMGSIGRSKISRYGIAIVGDRFLFGSALNKFWFYDFFSKFPKVHFADGTLGKLLGSTNLYRYSSGQMVDAFFTGSRLGVASYNTGYLGDGYAEAGVLGVLLCAVVLAYIVAYISNYEGKMPFTILAPMTVWYVIVLADVALTTVLLTSGLLIFIFLLAVYAGESEERGKS